jgi:hypothetical protein
VPKSSVRKKKVYTPPAELRPQASTAAKRRPSPTWVPVTAVGFFLFAIVWLVTYYLTNQWSDLGDSFTFLVDLQFWNLAIGFGAMVISIGLLSRWR